jgi:hypothetical protein
LPTITWSASACAAASSCANTSPALAVVTLQSTPPADAAASAVSQARSSCAPACSTSRSEGKRSTVLAAAAQLNRARHWAATASIFEATH